MEVNDIIKFEIEFDNPDKTYTPQSLVKGKIIVTPYRNLEIESFHIQPVYQLKSGWQNETKRLDDAVVKDFTWNGGEDYTYRFSFKLNQLPSYKSDRLNVRWFIESKIKLKSASKNEIRSLLGKDFQFTKMANPDKLLDNQFEFSVLPSKNARSIAKKKFSIYQHIGKNKSNGLIIAAIVLLVVGYKSTFMLLLAFFLGYQGIKKGKHLKGIISSKVGDLAFTPVDREKFRIKLDVGNAYRNIQKIKMDFKVDEVIGTHSKNAKSSNLHTDSISFENELIQPGMVAEFSYPEANIPTSIKINGQQIVKFKWFVELTFFYKNGRTFITTETFKAVWDKQNSAPKIAATL